MTASYDWSLDRSPGPRKSRSQRLVSIRNLGPVRPAPGVRVCHCGREHQRLDSYALECVSCELRKSMGGGR